MNLFNISFISFIYFKILEGDIYKIFSHLKSSEINLA